MDLKRAFQPLADRDARRLLIPVLLGLTVVLAALLVPPWVQSWWTGLRSIARYSIASGFLQTALIGYGVVALIAFVGGTVSLRQLTRGGRSQSRRMAWARVLLLSVSCACSLILVELGSLGYNRWSHRAPDMPSVPPPEAQLVAQSGGEELVLLVLGESSAEGHPFQGFLSIGHIVAWQMERALPGTKVNVIMGASGGIPLASAFPQLEKQTRRPDLVLVYAGHNEFQARWGWTHAVRHYIDEVLIRPPSGLIDLIGNWTPFCKMLREVLERQQIDRPPTARENRILGDRPVCEPKVRARLRDLFQKQLEVIAQWCERAGSLPIFVIPAGNDVGYDPGRSILEPNTTSAEREAFYRDFAAVKEQMEALSDPIASMRGLIARQPGFAEAHYRLAQLLQDEGEVEEARAEYVLARDLDGMPMRCPSEFQNAYRAVASLHDLILIDGPDLLQRLSPTGLLDDHVFHDGQHPTFRAYLELSQNVMDQLWAQGAFGLPRGPAPRVDPAECAAYFGMDSTRWADVCRRSVSFWSRLAVVRHDASARLAHAARYEAAASAIEAGSSPEAVGVPGLGIAPQGFP